MCETFKHVFTPQRDLMKPALSVKEMQNMLDGFFLLDLAGMGGLPTLDLAILRAARKY